MVDPCKAKPSGKTLIELGKAYNENTACIGKYKLQMKKQREHKKKMMELYNEPSR